MLSKKILIIDDEPEFVQLLGERLAASGYEVSSAGDGKQGLSQIIIVNPDLIILDSLMPVMNGLQFLEKYRENEQFRKIPVIVVSARKGVEDFFKDMPIQDFVVKPLDMDAFLGKIEKVLGKQETRATSGPAPKRVLVVGVDHFTQEKISEFFKTEKWEVALAQNEEEAYQTALSFSPDVILCQYWDIAWEGGQLNTQLLAKRLQEEHSLSRIQFTVYCPEGPILDAMKVFQESQLIKYKESSDLLKEVARRFGIYSS